MSTFDLVIAQELSDSKDKFPVDFVLAWKWAGYSRKKQRIKNAYAIWFRRKP